MRLKTALDFVHVVTHVFRDRVFLHIVLEIEVVFLHKRAVTRRRDESVEQTAEVVELCAVIDAPIASSDKEQILVPCEAFLNQAVGGQDLGFPLFRGRAVEDVNLVA